MKRCRSPHGERGLKCRGRVIHRIVHSRSPHGERGLKCVVEVFNAVLSASLSSWRAWIEIREINVVLNRILSRSPHGVRGLKCPNTFVLVDVNQSLSSWRAWIEITLLGKPVYVSDNVALLMESVD